MNLKSAVLILGSTLPFLFACRGGPPCVNSYQILSVGDEVDLTVGRRPDNSDCRFEAGPEADFKWEAQNPIVRFERSGVARAVATGNFQLIGQKGKELLKVSGMALPSGWTIKINPASVTVRPKETVSFEVSATMPNGATLPDVPFAIFPEEFEKLPPESKVVTPRALFGTNAPVVFTALAPGETTVIASIGRKRAKARIVVVGDSGDARVAQPGVAPDEASPRR